jgi:hypothetical protein
LGFAIGEQAHHDGMPNRVHLRYGLIVHLRLLSTPPRGDAVTFGYGMPEHPDMDFHLADPMQLPAHSPFAPAKGVNILSPFAPANVANTSLPFAPANCAQKSEIAQPSFDTQTTQYSLRTLPARARPSMGSPHLVSRFHHPARKTRATQPTIDPNSAIDSRRSGRAERSNRTEK